ncbi:nicotinamide-nucleotide amidohydrolase family protein [candidate division WOR-3 bacterium]|nr:nicotinamide-nucleotide amidohydrolase family protein [candidate division WOR-3 bacterium]
MNIYQRAAFVGSLLKKTGMTISVCESCTGGMLGSVITSVAGSSEYFKGGVIAYANNVKVRIVGVRATTLQRYGAVSKQTAREMAQRVRDSLQTDIGLGITGIAGPTGGSRTKPVGCVYISVAIGKKIVVKEYTFQGTRKDIRKKACTRALHLLEATISHGRSDRDQV